MQKIIKNFSISNLLLFIKLIPNIFVFYFLLNKNFLFSAIFLALVVFVEFLTGLYKEKLNKKQEKIKKKINTFLDFFCFGITPSIFLIYFFNFNYLIIFGVIIFLFAGIFRIMRFNKEGLINGKYKGLPITYSNYIFSGVFLLNYFLFSFGNDILLLVYLFVIFINSYLMITDKIYIPEY